MTLTVSEVSARSPDMSDAQFAEFVEDIKTNGQLVPIWVSDGVVIDGRKRLRACEVLGIKPRTVETWPGQDAEALSRSLNSLRTHYTVGQLAMHAAERTNLSRGRPVNNPAIAGITERQAAGECGIQQSSVSMAKVVKRDGAPEVTEAVKAGSLTLHAAKQIVKAVPKPKQAEAVRKVIEASKGKAKQTSAAVVIGSQAGKRVQSAPPISRQWNELLNQAEFAADNLEASADRAAEHEQAKKWAERVRSVRATLSKVIHLLEGQDESEAA
jgi:hypothetical protein